MKQFHPLIVSAKTNENRDSVRIALDVPEALRDEFVFLPGQHLPIQIERGRTATLGVVQVSLMTV